MKDLVRTTHPISGNASLTNVVQHLRSSLNCKNHDWSPGQREAAQRAVDEAEELLTTGPEEVITLPFVKPRLSLVDPRPLYQREFSTFPLITEPIPEGFFDSSWCNNATPEFKRNYPDGKSLYIQIDWPHPADREAGPEAHRYVVCLRDAKGEQVGDCFSSDDWQQTVAALALFPPFV